MPTFYECPMFMMSTCHKIESKYIFSLKYEKLERNIYYVLLAEKSDKMYNKSYNFEGVC